VNADDDNGDMSYPVLEIVQVRAPQRRWFRRATRSELAVPPAGPGRCLVAQLAHGYRKVPFGIGADDPVLAGAVALMLLSTAHRTIAVSVHLPCADTDRVIEVRGGFRCHVDDPIAFLRAGGEDVRDFLSDYLLRFHRVRMTCLAMSLSDRERWQHLRQRVSAMLLAYGEIMPVLVPGVTASLTDVSVGARAVERDSVSPPPPDFAEAEAPDPGPHRRARGRDATYTWGPPL
jgi:hypothetical protein